MQLPILFAQYHDIIMTLPCDPMVARTIARRLHQAALDLAPLWGLSAIEAEDIVCFAQETPCDVDLPLDDHYLGQLLGEGGAA